MSESSGPVPAPRRPLSEEDRLDSWKEIARYLGREVRTVQGWEKKEGLPVHRHQHGQLGSIYAFKSELDAWRESRKGVPESESRPQEAAPDVPAARSNTFPLIALAAGILLAIAGAFWWKLRTNVAATAPPLSSVVVLPFLDLSPQKDQDYFSDGLTEEIIDALSRVPNLRVVARTSAFAFKGKNADIRQIGQQLNVSNVLEGSVRKDGDKLRITAQLNRVTDGTHLWSRTFDKQLADVFAVQREISQAIADQLRAGQVPQREPTANMEAYRAYQEGRYFFNQHIPTESYSKAIGHYEQAIKLDPQFALAYSGLSDAYAYLAENFINAPREVMPKAKEAAEKAVKLNDNLGEAHVSRGLVKLDWEWDVAGAQAEFQRAMQLSPGSSWGHHWYAHTLEAQNRLPEAIKEMHAALDLDPLSVVVHWDIINEYIMAHQYDNAVQRALKSMELFPNHPILQYFLSIAYLRKGDLTNARRTIDAVTAEFPAKLVLSAILAAKEGHREQASADLARLEALRSKEYVDSVLVLDLCEELHDERQMRRWLQFALDDRSTLFAYLPVMHPGNKEVAEFIAKAR